MYTAGSTGVAEQAGLFPTVRFEVFTFCWWCGGDRFFIRLRVFPSSVNFVDSFPLQGEAILLWQNE